MAGDDGVAGCSRGDIGIRRSDVNLETPNLLNDERISFPILLFYFLQVDRIYEFIFNAVKV